MKEKKNESPKTSNTLREPLVSDSMEANEVGPTPIVEKIGEFEKLCWVLGSSDHELF